MVCCSGVFWGDFLIYFLKGRKEFSWLIPRYCGLVQSPTLCWWLALFVKRTHCALTKCHSACATIWDMVERWGQRSAVFPFIFVSKELFSSQWGVVWSFLTCFGASNEQKFGRWASEIQATQLAMIVHCFVVALITTMLSVVSLSRLATIVSLSKVNPWDIFVLSFCWFFRLCVQKGCDSLLLCFYCWSQTRHTVHIFVNLNHHLVKWYMRKKLQ